MFDVSMFEIFIVAIIALIVLGPERLPRAAREAGVWFGRIKRMLNQWTSEVNRQMENEVLLQDLRKQKDLEQISQEMSSINESISRSLSGQNLGLEEQEASLADRHHDKGRIQSEVPLLRKLTVQS